MKERPILFSAPMVRALLDDMKIQTRRVAKDMPPKAICAVQSEKIPDEFIPWAHGEPLPSIVCPYGKTGDRLWVREAHSLSRPPHSSGSVWYWADGNPPHGDWTKPRPSIHMHRWASRILLEVTSTNVERLKEITTSDALSEGIRELLHGAFHWQASNVSAGPTARAAYRALWESINGAGSWDANPWVWVVEFKRLAT